MGGTRQVCVLIACGSAAAAVAGVLLRAAAMRRGLPVAEYANDPVQGLPLAVTFSVCGAILWGYPRARPVGRVMLVSGALTGFGGLCVGLESFVTPTPGTAIEAVDGIGGLAALLGVVVALVALPQVFPDGLLPGQSWRLLAWISVAVVVAAVLNLLVSSLLFPNQEWPWTVGSAVVIVTGLVSLVSLVVRWLRADAPLRRQILGFLLASAVPVAVLLAGLLPPWQDVQTDWVQMFWPIGIAAAVLVAVVQHDLYEIRSTVRRAALYAATVAVLTGVFALIYFVLLGALSEPVVDNQFRWMAVVAATAVILAVDPVRRRLLTGAERRLLGQRSDPLPALSRIGAGSSPDAFGTIVDTVATALASPGVALSARDHNETRMVACFGEPGPKPVTVPLSYGGELVGQLAVAPRTPGEPFQPADVALLHLLAVQAATQLYVARRDAELTQLRQETLQQSATLRAQLGQDLHDGLAPLLAGASLTADALRRGMPPGSRDEADAARLSDRLLQASTEVRRLAHSLQPAVGDRGLARAIGEYIADLHGPDAPAVTADVAVDDLPPAVMEAAYLIVLESTSNAVRHGRPRHVWIRVHHNATEVSITVEDDGDGINQPYVSGLGITSMRRRADALRWPDAAAAPTRWRHPLDRHPAEPAVTDVAVLVVDDHAVFREGLRALLDRIDGIEVVGEAGTTDQAIDAAAEVAPDVILMDLHIPGAGGVAATETILARAPDTAVLVLTMHDDDLHLRDAIQAGARGYLLKDSGSDAIIDAILAVHRGQLIFDRGVAEHLRAVTTGRHTRRPFPILTDRELDILDRIARGLSNEAIATRMGINTKTVQNNVSNILLKLGARDRAEAVAVARDAGLGH